MFPVKGSHYWRIVLDVPDAMDKNFANSHGHARLAPPLAVTFPWKLTSTPSRISDHFDFSGEGLVLLIVQQGKRDHPRANTY